MIAETRRTDLISACNKLILFYKVYEDKKIPPAYGSVHHGKVCPFCEVVGRNTSIKSNEIECAGCPWILFNGRLCTASFDEKMNKLIPYYAETTEMRQNRLCGWSIKLGGGV